MTCEKGWDEIRRAEMRWEELSQFEMRWSVECEVRSVKRGVWRAQCEVWRKCSLGAALRRGRSRAGHVLGQQQRNRFAQSTHARAWLAQGACKFYRWERSYNITLRQLPPRLVRVRVLLACQCIYIYVCIFVFSTVTNISLTNIMYHYI